MERRNRWSAVFVVAACVGCALLLVMYPSSALRTRNFSVATGSSNFCPGDMVTRFSHESVSILTKEIDAGFYCVGKKYGTDKVTTHKYDYVYSKYLGPFHHYPLRLLEIGLGCGMPWGPGGSYKVWREYLPNSYISILEYGAACAEEFRSTIEGNGGKLYIGSQAEPEVLQAVVDDVAKLGAYDMIVDDGSHNPRHQLTSFLGLWSALKPGGVYVVEDMAFMSYRKEYVGKDDTFIAWVKRITDLLHCVNVRRNRNSPGFTEDSLQACENATLLEREVLSVECMLEACVVVKGLKPWG